MSKEVKIHETNDQWQGWELSLDNREEFRSMAFSIVFIELLKSELKHPVFPEGQRGMSIIAEEFIELLRSENDNSPVDHRLEEAAHVAVTAIRHIENLMKEKEWSLRNGDPKKKN